MLHDSVEALRRIPLFASLALADLGRLAQVTRRRRFSRGQILFERGEPGNDLYILLRGRVRIFAETPAGSQVVLGYLQAGECFGELSLLDGLPRSAGVQAIDEGEALLLSRQDFLQFLRADVDVAIALLGVLSHRLRRTNDLLEDSAFLDVMGRLAKRLLELLDSEGRSTDSGVAIPVPLSQSELAAMIGASRESVSKALHDLVRRQIVETGRGRILIKDAAALKRRAIPWESQ